MKPWEDGKSLDLQVLRTWYAKQMCLINGGGCSDTLLEDEDAKKMNRNSFSCAGTTSLSLGMLYDLLKCIYAIACISIGFHKVL